MQVGLARRMFAQVAVLLVVAVSAMPMGRSLAAQTRQVTGRVLGASDSVAVSGVRIELLDVRRTAVSDERGAFALVDVPGRAFRMVLSRLGFHTDTVTVPPGLTALDVYLVGAAVEVAPLVAEARPVARQRFETVAQTSVITLEPAEIASVPAVLEADVTRVVQLLPGTVTKNDFTTGLNVRGGESDQNLIQLDGATVFNPFHLGGLFSTFDTEAVDRVDFITGGFPANYGGRLSSVLDVRLRPGSTERVNARGQLSLLSSKLLLDGPLGSGGGSFMVGARRTYADLLVSAFSKEDLPYYFADGMAKLTQPLGNGVVSLTGYWGGDALDWPWVDPEPGRDGVDLEFAWGNRVLGLNVHQPFGAVDLDVHVSGSGFSTGLGLEPDIVRVENSVRAWSAGASLAIHAMPSHALSLGVAVDDYRMDYEIRSSSLAARFFDATYAPTVWSAFLDDQWTPFNGILVRPGARVEHVAGAAFTGVSPRVAIKAFVHDDFAVTGSAGRYYQAIHSLRDPDIPYTIFDFWVGADRFVPVARADHLVAGFERWWGPAVSLSVEGYRKTFADLVVRNTAQDLKVAGDEFLTTAGDAWGADVLLRRHQGSFTGWIAYGYAKATRVADGREFAPAHDRRHTVNLVLMTGGPLGSDMSVRWGYGSPLPFTGFVGEWRHRRYNAATHAFDDFDEEPVAQAALNAERYPYYNRLDLSFRWSVDKWGGVLRPYVQFVNAYNRGNVFIYLFDYQDSPATRTGISQLPLLPSFGVEFAF